MERKKKRHWMAAAVCLLLLGGLMWSSAADGGKAAQTVSCSAISQQKKLVPVGKTVGIKLFSHGVMVVGLESVQTANGECSPAKDSGLKVGDIITKLDGEQVDTIEEVESIMQQKGGEALAVTAMRSGRRLEVTAEAAACLSDGSYKLGAWVRDSMAGIGTVSWYDPETKCFCALGHGINDLDTNLLMPLKNGGIMASSVTGILKGSSGSPGQLHGSFDLTQDLGKLTKNTDYGVFGQLYDTEFEGTAFPVASRSQVKTGTASILSNIEGETVREYSVEILRIYPSTASDTRNLMIQVTDPELLEKTGGIVQGMSGSPILQNNQIVGAVTHVLVNDPTRGYGILVENMLKAAE